jgi:hypothetical protein
LKEKIRRENRGAGRREVVEMVTRCGMGKGMELKSMRDGKKEKGRKNRKGNRKGKYRNM